MKIDILSMLPIKPELLLIAKTDYQISSYKDYVYKCSECGEEVFPVEINGVWYKANCNCVRQRLKDKALESEKKNKLLEKVKNIYSGSMMPKRYQEYTFENWMGMYGTEKVFGIAKDYIDNWENNCRNGEGLLIFGGTGSGKSHVAAAIANDMIKRGFLVVFVNVVGVLDKIKSNFGDNKAVQEIKDAMQNADLLILDDMGAEQYSEWAEKNLYLIIDGRYNNKKPFIITTNLNVEELCERVGVRTWDRIQEVCTIVENKADSYRGMKALQKAKEIKKDEKYR